MRNYHRATFGMSIQYDFWLETHAHQRLSTWLTISLIHHSLDIAAESPSLEIRSVDLLLARV